MPPLIASCRAPFPCATPNRGARARIMARSSEGSGSMRVVTVEQMRAIERRAESEHGLTSPILMEHAGRSVAELLREALGSAVSGCRVLVLVGPGNNGGDGRVMGRYLAEWGADVTLYAWKERRLEAR